LITLGKHAKHPTDGLEQRLAAWFQLSFNPETGLNAFVAASAGSQPAYALGGLIIACQV